MSVDLSKGATVELVKTLSDDIRTLPDGAKAEKAGAVTRLLMETKADADGAYPDIIAGNVFSDDSYTEDKTPYLYRVSGGGVEVGKVEADQIVGGTIAFNQLAHELNDDGWRKEDGVTVTYADGVATISSTTAGNGLVQRSNSPVVKGHKYLVTADFKADEALSNIRFGANTSSGLFLNVNVSTQWATYSLVGESLTNNGALFVYHTGSTYSNLSVRNAMLIDLTQMFGSIIADYIYSLEQANSGAGVALFRKMFPNAYYAYNAGELKHVSGVSEHVMTGYNRFDINDMIPQKHYNTDGVLETQTYRCSTPLIPVEGTLALKWSTMPIIDASAIVCQFDGSKNLIYRSVPTVTDNGLVYALQASTKYVGISFYSQGDVNGTLYDVLVAQGSDNTYEPYEKHSYPLDSSLILRGVPKVADGKMYYDGDVYTADGKVQRKYGIVDLGSLTWSGWEQNGSMIFNANIADKLQTRSDPCVCANYVYNADFYNSWSDLLDGQITGSLSNSNIYVRDTRYSDIASFKTAMNGVYLVYKLATPTEETAEPYTEYQKVSKGGTEEYVSTSIVPVGHVTKYPTDIVSKVDGLPSDFSTLIAPTEIAMKATRNYTVNQFLIVNNQLYKVTAAIASGATITPNTNVTAVTVADILTQLLNA